MERPRIQPRKRRLPPPKQRPGKILPPLIMKDLHQFGPGKVQDVVRRLIGLHNVSARLATYQNVYNCLRRLDENNLISRDSRCVYIPYRYGAGFMAEARASAIDIFEE